MSETTDEFLTVGWLLGAPMAWAGKMGYHAAQRVGMRYQNWRYGGTTQDGSSAPATTQTGAASSGKGGNWTTIETSETTHITYQHTATSKWTK